MQDLLTLYTARADGFDRIAAGVGDWDAATPCEGWTARDVVRHVVDTQRDFLTARGLEGLPPASDAQASDADPYAAWQQHRAAVDAALPDLAGVTYDSYFGPSTIGATMADFYGWDLVVHGWDLASGSGQSWSLSDQEAERMMRTADGFGPALYSEGICAPAVPVADDAPLQDRLLARLGRDPHWTA